MAILKIARMGHRVLAQPARTVTDPADPDVGRLIADMRETLEDASGVGLSAPQIHEAWRMVVLKLPAEEVEDEEGEGEAAANQVPPPPPVLINLEIEPVDGETAVEWEACLSLPGLTGAVPRYTRVRFRCLDEDGRAVEGLAEDYVARVLQHECDHLDGILFPMRMPDLSLFGFAEEIRRPAAGHEEEGEEDREAATDRLPRGSAAESSS